MLGHNFRVLGSRAICPQLSTPFAVSCLHVRSLHHHRISNTVLKAVDFDEDPNTEPPSSNDPQTQQPPVNQRTGRRFQSVKPSQSRRAGNRKYQSSSTTDDNELQEETQQNDTRYSERNKKPTPEELKAMGYDDVDDFDDDNLEAYEPMQLREDHPMYVPVLTDEELAEDPPDHKSGYVAVIGRPNAGKSTLINALVGQKLSIVTFKPQTTRHRIMGIASEKDYQMILFDTPGIIEKKRTKLEERMMAAVVGSIQDSEAIIAVVDAADRPKQALSMFQPGSNWTGPPMAVLLNKADLLNEEQVEELSNWYKENCRAEQVFVGCAADGGSNTGIEAIKAWAVSKLPLGPTLYSKEVVSEQPQRFFVAEIIREKIFLHYEHEIPYCTQVQIREWRERPKPRKLFISATIMVSKESQVGIVIGKDGQALKAVGKAARQDIEEFLEQPVYLELGVQLSEKWQEDQEALQRFGYFDPILI